MVQKTIREHEANGRLYEFLLSTYQFLDRTDQPVENIHLIFLLQLSQFLGFTPHGSFGQETPYLDLMKGSFEAEQHPIYTLNKKASYLISELSQHVLATSHHVHIGRQDRQQLIQNLLTFYKLHLEKMSEIQTHKILADVL